MSATNGRPPANTKQPSQDSDNSRLETAARAGWLYYIAGNTQDEIARKLKVSRATAQRLVSLCLTQRLITFRLEHPIANCMSLAAQLRDVYELKYCDVAPTDSSNPHSLVGVAELAAVFLEGILRGEKPSIIGIGTGRAMRATVERVAALQAPDHQLVSLVGNLSPGGAASPFDAVARLANLTGAEHYPMPLPVFVPSEHERQALLGLQVVKRMRALATKADLRLVGVGHLDHAAPLHVDGFISRTDLIDLMRLGAVGEIVGWAMNASGRVLEGGTNRLITSVPLQVPPHNLTVAVAIGKAKVAAIQAAMRGRIVNGLITDEATAKAILKG